MPPRELSRIFGRKHESGECAPSLDDIPYWVDDALSELVFDNGKVTVKSQPTGVSRAPLINNSPPVVSNARRASGKGEKLVDLGSFSPDNSLFLPSVELDLCENDDEMATWLGYPFADSSEQQQYCPELLPEASGVLKSGFLEAPAASNQMDALDMFNESRSWKMESQRKVLPMSSSKRVNFPYFSRYNTHLHSSAEIPSSVEIKGKFSATAGGTSMNKSSDFHVPLLRDEGGPEKEASNKNEKLPNCSTDHVNEIPDDGGAAETEVACSVSCNQTKGKSSDIQESGSRSDDNTKCAGEKRRSTLESGATAPSKRRRVAEVHNLSERRRRDRINEKMKALQELIPNSNKTDKASMLDQATQYLKMLKHQVQIMSMGGGMCMPQAQMMFPAPAGMQPMFLPHFTHFPQMGAEFGLGMLDNRFPIPPGIPTHFSLPVSGPSSFNRVDPSVAVFGQPGLGHPFLESQLPPASRGNEQGDGSRGE